MLIYFPATAVDKIKFYACLIYESEIRTGTASADTEDEFPLSVAIRSTLHRIAYSTHSFSTLQFGVTLDMNTELFRAFTQRVVVISYRSFGTNYQSLPQC